MFKRIARSLALQFTGFVFLLLLLTGAIFLAAELAATADKPSFGLPAPHKSLQSKRFWIPQGL